MINLLLATCNLQTQDAHTCISNDQTTKKNTQLPFTADCTRKIFRLHIWCRLTAWLSRSSGSSRNFPGSLAFELSNPFTANLQIVHMSQDSGLHGPHRIIIES